MDQGRWRVALVALVVWTGPGMVLSVYSGFHFNREVVLWSLFDNREDFRVDAKNMMFLAKTVFGDPQPVQLGPEQMLQGSGGFFEQVDHVLFLQQPRFFVVMLSAHGLRGELCHQANAFFSSSRVAHYLVDNLPQRTGLILIVDACFSGSMKSALDRKDLRGKFVVLITSVDSKTESVGAFFYESLRLGTELLSDIWDSNGNGRLDPREFHTWVVLASELDFANAHQFWICPKRRRLRQIRMGGGQYRRLGSEMSDVLEEPEVLEEIAWDLENGNSFRKVLLAVWLAKEDLEVGYQMLWEWALDETEPESLQSLAIMGLIILGEWLEKEET